MLKLLPASGAASAHRYDAILDDTHTNESQCTGKLTHAARQCSRMIRRLRARAVLVLVAGFVRIRDEVIMLQRTRVLTNSATDFWRRSNLGQALLNAEAEWRWSVEVCSTELITRSDDGYVAATPSSTPVIASSDMMISRALEPGEEELTCSVLTSLQRPVYS